jgi:hypothetical protein
MGGAEYSPPIVRLGGAEGNIAIWKLFGKLVDIDGLALIEEENAVQFTR